MVKCWISFTKEDSKDVLDSLNIQLSKDIKCSVCDKEITYENFGGVRKGKDGNVFCCDEFGCSAIYVIEGEEDDDAGV